MGKLVPASLLADYGKSTSTIATCWKVTRTDGVVKGFTNCTHSLTVQGIRYESKTGFNASQVSTKMGFQVDNLEITGPQDNDSLTFGSILSGIWDFAYVQVFEVNYKDVSKGINILREGWLGDLSAGTIPFTAELRGLMQMVQTNIGRIVQPPCDADLGDARCGINLDTFPNARLGTTVTSVISPTHWTDVNFTEPAAGWWNTGKVLFITGQNAGLTREIRIATPPNVHLQLPFPYPVAGGDTYYLYTFCDKSNVMCNDKFGNITNNRGFPFSPNTLDAVGT